MGRIHQRAASARHPCFCDTGSYCHKHQRYRTQPKEISCAVAIGTYLESDQRCGGGRRVLKKAIERN